MVSLKKLFLLLGVLFFWCGVFAVPKFEDFKLNRPELSLPLLDRKMVIAHNMPYILYHKDENGRSDTVRFLNFDEFDPFGETKNMGGEVQTIAYDIFFNADKDIVEAAAFHQKAAVLAGIDGFQFYYPVGTDSSFLLRINKFIVAHFKAAEKYKTGMKFCVCISHPPAKMPEDEKIEVIAQAMRDLYVSVGVDNPSWLKTPDGRHIHYTWAGDSLHTVQPGETGPKMKYVAYAYEKLAERSGAPAAFIPTGDTTTPEAIKERLEWFPAYWDFAENKRRPESRDIYKQICQEKGRTFTHTVYCDFYCSKIYPINTKRFNMYHNRKDVIPLKASDVQRDMQYLGVAELYFKQLSEIPKYDPQIINVTTWNDYPEGHHMAPEINHNFGFWVLLNHYKNIWLGTPEKNKRQWMVLAYKKYRSDCIPEPHFVRYLQMHPDLDLLAKPEDDDFINLFAYFRKPVFVYINGERVGKVSPKKVSMFKVPTKPGKVHVEAKSGAETVMELEPPEPITDKPFRTDRLTYCYSTEFDRYYDALFGKAAPRYYLRQYQTDSDGVPFWKKGRSVGVRHPDGREPSEEELKFANGGK